MLGAREAELGTGVGPLLRAELQLAQRLLEMRSQLAGQEAAAHAPPPPQAAAP